MSRAFRSVARKATAPELTHTKLAPPNVVLGSKPRYAVPESLVLLGISRGLLFQRIEQGALSVVRDGRRIFLTDDEIRRYCASSRP
jgi:hypothetical protein